MPRSMGGSFFNPVTLKARPKEISNPFTNDKKRSISSLLNIIFQIRDRSSLEHRPVVRHTESSPRASGKKLGLNL